MTKNTCQVLALLWEGGKEEVRCNTGMSFGSKLIFFVKCYYFVMNVLCFAMFIFGMW